jgi:hypothetical protein
VKPRFYYDMSPKLIDRSVYQYLLFLAISTFILPSAAVADTSTGSFGISLQVVARCNLPTTGSTELAPGAGGMQHPEIKCSAQAKPADVKVLISPANIDSMNQYQSVTSENNQLNILVSY